MKQYGNPKKIINIIKLFYTENICAVLDDDKESECFHVKTGVKQGCVMSGFLFLLVIDWVMKKTTKDNNSGIRWYEDLDFADDIALLSTIHAQMQKKTNSLASHAKQVELKINSKKTKTTRLNAKKGDAANLEETDIKEVEEFPNLGAIVSKEGGGERERHEQQNK